MQKKLRNKQVQIDVLTNDREHRPRVAMVQWCILTFVKKVDEDIMIMNCALCQCRGKRYWAECWELHTVDQCTMHILTLCA